MLAPFISRLRNRVWLWLLALIGAFLGALPDLLGAYGFLVEHDSRLYLSAHSGSIKEVLQCIPMYGLHLYIDLLTHDQPKQWYGWNRRLWLDVLLWLVNIAVIYWFVKVWKRNAAKGQS
jgi:hypothetical protein